MIEIQADYTEGEVAGFEAMYGTPVDFTLHFGAKPGDVHFQVDLDPKETSVHVSAIELSATHAQGKVVIEVHDSGPGLSEQARNSLFQPTISFKKRGMGLGLSIARKSALLSGGDIVAVPGELGGAAFRVVLPNSSNGVQKSSDC